MAGLSSWVDSNINVIQSVGAIGGLLVGILVAVQTARAQEEKNRATLAEQHRNLWSEISHRPDLSRVLKSKVNLHAAPVTTAEEEFLNLVFIHFERGWQLAKQGSVNTLETLEADQCEFISLPIPNVVWKRTQKTRDFRFVRFINRAIERIGRENYQ